MIARFQTTAMGVVRLGVIFMWAGAIADAQEAAPDTYAAWRQLSAEHVECTVYYSITGICMESANDKSVSDRINAMKEAMFDRAVRLTAKGNLKAETIDARSKLAMDSMMKEIGKDCGNISVLVAKYGNACKVLFENPAFR